MNMEEVIKSKKGGKLLVYRGYSFEFDKNGLEKKLWRCTQHRNHSCRGRLHSVEYIPENGETVEVLRETGEHNHTPDAASIEKTKVLNKVKSTAAASTDSTVALEGASAACRGKGPKQCHFYGMVWYLM